VHFAVWGVISGVKVCNWLGMGRYASENQNAMKYG
jgi:hypothetical protein